MNRFHLKAYSLLLEIIPPFERYKTYQNVCP
jgi:hypothetical protein